MTEGETALFYFVVLDLLCLFFLLLLLLFHVRLACVFCLWHWKPKKRLLKWRLWKGRRCASVARNQNVKRSAFTRSRSRRENERRESRSGRDPAHVRSEQSEQPACVRASERLNRRLPGSGMLLLRSHTCPNPLRMMDVCARRRAWQSASAHAVLH